MSVRGLGSALAFLLCVELGVGLGVGLAAGAARAQAPDEEQSVQRVEDIVVREEALEPAEIFEDAPVEKEILTVEEIRELPARNAAEVLDKLPGVNTRPRVQGEEAAVSIEGMPPEYTQLLVDGERYTGELGAAQDLRDLPLENLERIEILRGVQGLRHGPSAGGGVIDLIRKEPPREGWRGSVDGGAGQDGAVQGSGTIAGGSDALGASFSFDHDEIDGFDAPEDTDGLLVGGSEGSHRLSRDLHGDLVWRPRPELSFTTRVGWRREDEELVFEGGGAGARTEERWRVAQEMEAFVGEATRLTGTLQWFDWTLDGNVARSFVLEEDETKLDVALEHFFDTGPLSHALAFGADGRLQRLRLDEGPLPEGIENDALEGGQRVEEGFRQLGLYVTNETEITSFASLELGARLQLHGEFSPAVVPQAALLLRPHETLKVRASWGRNRRTPSLRDLYQPPVPQQGGAYFLAGNPRLEPERSSSWRLGFEYRPRSWVSVSTVGFWNEIDDHIRSDADESLVIRTERIPIEPDDRPPECEGLNPLPEFCRFRSETVRSTLFRRTNLDSVTTRGVEARLELRPWEFAQMQLGYTYLDTELTDSNLQDVEALPDSPPHSVTGRLRLEAPRSETALTLRAEWRDRALLENVGTALPSFTTGELSDPSFVLDARLVQPFGERFEAYLDLQNLTDERTVGTTVVRGRTAFVGLRVQLGSE